MKTLHEHIATDGFRLRGTAMSRVDGFSDVVFGFALTLLVVSLEVPKTYSELHQMVRGFLPFAISFVLLLMIWYEHFQFFRRFGVEDFRTIVLNSCLLFVVLFYVYPLKFLFSLMVGGLLEEGHAPMITASQSPELMVLYGGGFAAIYLLLAGLYWNGWRQREELELSPLERLLTKGYMADTAAKAGVGLLSCAIALLLPPDKAGMSGFAYFLIGLTKTGVEMFVGRRRRALAAPIAGAEPPRVSG